MGHEFESDEEMIDYYQSVSLTTKDDVKKAIKLTKLEWKLRSKEDLKHSPSYYAVLDNLINRFVSVLDNTLLFDAPSGMWGYYYHINSDGISLMLEHAFSVEFNDNKYITSKAVDQEFTLLTVETKMLTCEEYAQLYNVKEVTVRQWIRRGKLRTAKKYGNEWRIPELTEVYGRGYLPGKYEWKEKLNDVPDQYKFLIEPGSISISQDNIDKTKYHISSNNGYNTVLNNKEREKLELFLISHPLVKCTSDTYGYFS